MRGEVFKLRTGDIRRLTKRQIHEQYIRPNVKAPTAIPEPQNEDELWSAVFIMSKTLHHGNEALAAAEADAAVEHVRAHPELAPWNVKRGDPRTDGGEGRG